MANNYTLRRKQRVSGWMTRWLSRTFLDQKLYNWFGFILLGFIAAVIGYSLANQTMVGLSIIAVVFGLCIALPCLASAETALYFILFYNYFIYVVPRLLDNEELKVGLGYDVLLVFGILGFVLRRDHLKEASNHLFRTQVMIWTLVLLAYNLVELFNPLAHTLTGWYDNTRKYMETFLVFFMAYHVFDSWKRIDRWLQMVFWASFLVGVYGCIEQWHGLFPFEMVQINRIKWGQASVYFAGVARKFSTTSSPTAFGMDMAAAAVMFIILGLNEKRRGRKWLYLIGVIPMVLGMSYSGTRTANIMLVGGLGMYVLLHANEQKTRLFAGAATVLLLLVLYLPYGNATLNRFRSSFQGKKDDSYLVREVNRRTIQPYIYDHPFGGGLGTTNAQGITYNPGHYLAGFQTDDGYLKTALEIGWIGLLITCILYFVILRRGVAEFFSTRNERNRSVLAACTVFLFAWMVGDLAQEGIFEISNVPMYFPAIAILLRANYVPEGA